MSKYIDIHIGYPKIATTTLFSSFFGAILNIVLNLILIPVALISYSFVQIGFGIFYMQIKALILYNIRLLGKGLK